GLIDKRGRQAAHMAGANSGNVADDAAARQAARIAVELSEAGGPGPDGPDGFDGSGNGSEDSPGGPAGKKRIAGRLRGISGRTTSAVTGAAAGARRGADSARRGAGSAGRGVSSGVSSGMGWLTGQVLAMGPRLRIRDQAALRAQFPGQSDDEIAQRLVERAGRAAAAVGGTTGAWAALPVVPAFPAEVAAETLAVIGIEVKLVAELHEIYGLPAAGSVTEKARAYLGSWATRRGVHQVDGGLLLIAESPLARQLARRLASRVRRSAFALAPLFTGAVAGAVLNRRETRKLGYQIRDDLRQRRTTVTATVIS
ncbi:MAG TPA: hypothetical protein VGD91_21645, partial [Trebonia sp.]